MKMSAVDVVMAAAPWVYVVSRARVAWMFAADRITGRRRAGADWPAFSTWLFAFFLGVGLTFRLVPLRAAFDRWTGVPNLGWFLSFIAESTAVYVAACGCRAIPRLPIPRWLHFYMILTLLVFVLIYVTNIAAGIERLEYTTASTPFELVFMCSKYACLAVMTFFIGTAFVRLRRSERNKLTRLRLGLLSGSALMGVIYSSARTTFVLLAYFYPACPILSGLRALEKGSQIALALMWPLSAMLSSEVCLFVSKPFERLRKPALLGDLRQVQAELARLGLLAVGDDRSHPRRRSFDLRIYQALISILDGKRLLLAHLRALEEAGVGWGSSIPERTRLLQSREEEGSWDDGVVRQAWSFQQLLGRIDDNVGYFELIEAYRDVGRALRRSGGLPAAG
jgi:hypothetical protein